MATPLATLQGFLRSVLSADKCTWADSGAAASGAAGGGAGAGAGAGDELRAFVEANFDLMDEGVLRALVAAALKDREDNAKAGKEARNAEALLGTWGAVIDTVREVTGERQQRAGHNFQSVMAAAQQGQPKLVAAALTKLYREKQIDRLFVELLDSTLDECRKAGHEEYVAMLGFFKEVIEKNRAVAESLKARASAATPAAAATPPVPAQAPAAPAKAAAKPPPAPAATARGKDTTPFALDQPPTNRVEELDSDDEDSDDEDDDEEDDEEEDEEEEEEEEALPVLDDSTPPSSSTPRAPRPDEADEDDAAAAAEEHSQESLLQAGAYLTALLEQYKGDAAALRDRAQGDLCVRGKLPFSASALRRVVRDHLAAATQAGYVNRAQFMRFVLDRVLKPVEDALRQGAGAGAGTGAGAGAEEFMGELGETTYHAPKFVGDTGSASSGGLHVVTPEKFVDAEQVALGNGGKAGKVKGSKSAKKEQRRLLASLAKRMGAQLETQGWACCDRFLPEDLVRRVRIEAGLFAEHYEQSEIWVGKQADVGTLLSVPSVRGDKVIWMCGGHKGSAAPEGLTRAVRTIGEIEPCRLEAKARAPMRKFSALRELVASCDRLVDEMKKAAPSMAGIFERSDAMLANYPGGGSRFARHIDNTTGDGRRVTLLVYLNPGWTVDKGGALRLTPPAAGTAPAAATPEGVDVYPQCGRLVLFHSASMPHEVLPTFGDRHAITIWYYDKEERAAALARAKDSGRAEQVARAGTDAQREAKAFIADLMGGDEVDEQGGEPSTEELQALAHKVADLSPEALGIVSSITGAPSAQSFQQGFRLLVPQDLRQMRQLFRRMGLHDA